MRTMIDRLWCKSSCRGAWSGWRLGSADWGWGAGMLLYDISLHNECPLSFIISERMLLVYEMKSTRIAQLLDPFYVEGSSPGDFGTQGSPLVSLAPNR